MIKKIYYFLFCAVLLSACEEDISPREAAINKLTAAPWYTVSAIHETDGDLTFQYEEFSLVFAKPVGEAHDGDFYTANGFLAFPETTGKWTLAEDRNTIILGNDRVLEISFEKEVLVIGLEVPSEEEGGRTHGVSGKITLRLKH